MGESMVERPAIVDKMGESASSGAALEVSVSFGRFENDSLSWEKWSSFSTNKYLEEVEKCSTPGSVAQKKAYFEAHYKRIASRKFEQLEQEKPMESLAPTSDEPEHNDHGKNTSVTDVGSGLSKNSRSTGDVEPDNEISDIMNNTMFEKAKEDAAAVDCQDLSIEEAKKELNSNSANPESDDREETKEELNGSQGDLEFSARGEGSEVQEESTERISQDIVELPSKLDKEAKKTFLNKNESPKLHARNMTKKMTPSKKEQNLASAKKKVASPATKQPSATKLLQVSTPRLSKSAVMPAPQSSVKRFNGSPLPKGKITSSGENRKTVPTSLHMSLRLDAPNCGAFSTTTRKSFIMEKMGDKDIVRRAFKTFQNSINGLRSSSDGIFSGTLQASYKQPQQKVSATLIPQRENGGLRKSVENINQRGHVGKRSSLSSSGSHKVSGVDRKYGMVLSPSSSIKTDTRDEKRKEKLEEQQFVREVERAQLSAKAKVVKGNQMKNVRQGPNLKSTLCPASDKGKITSRVPSKKVDDKVRVDHQPLAKW